MARIAALVCMAFALSELAALAQSDSRNTFPGRRIGGGTRGLCTSRSVAHLTPANNIQRVSVTGPSRVAVLQGPTQQPYPLKVSLQGLTSFELPASPAGVDVLKLPRLNGDTRWESRYACPGGGAHDTQDPLSFVSVAAPPAVSLLSPSSDGIDQFDALAAHCGGSVALSQVKQWLGLDGLPGEWPQLLPVRCQDV